MSVCAYVCMSVCVSGKGEEHEVRSLVPKHPDLPGTEQSLKCRAELKHTLVCSKQRGMSWPLSREVCP